MIPYFGIVEMAFIAAIAWWWRSTVAAICVAAIMATISVRMSGLPFIPIASGIWALAGLVAFHRGEYVAGILYGASGMAYILWYVGLTDTRYAVIHYLSDLLCITGAVVGVWGGGGVVSISNTRRGVYRIGGEKLREN